MFTNAQRDKKVKTAHELVLKNCRNNAKAECLKAADECPDPIHKRRILSCCCHCYILEEIACELTQGEASAIVVAIADTPRSMSVDQIGERAGVKQATVRSAIRKYLNGMSERFGVEVVL